MPRSKRTKVRNMPPNQRKAVMANMSKKHRRWARMSRSQRREAGYLERYPIKSDEVDWKTAGGQRVARLYPDAETLRTASIDAKKTDSNVNIFEIPEGVDPDEVDYDVIIGPDWYAEGISGLTQSKNLCPICHRRLKDGYCMEHGDIKNPPGSGYAYQWNERKKRWEQSR